MISIAVLFCGPAAADSVPPTLVFQSPAQDGVVGGVERFKVQVSDQDGLAVSNPVRWGLEWGAS
jgi:hypothetical protein